VAILLSGEMHGYIGTLRLFARQLGGLAAAGRSVGGDWRTRMAGTAFDVGGLVITHRQQGKFKFDMVLKSWPTCITPAWPWESKNCSSASTSRPARAAAVSFFESGCCSGSAIAGGLLPRASWKSVT